MTAASNSESRKRLAASAAVESVLSQHERDVLIEASHPSRPDREALLVAAAERFLAARIEQARAGEGALRERCHNLVSDWQANAGSRTLGDPTDATWRKAAEQLRAALTEGGTDA